MNLVVETTGEVTDGAAGDMILGLVIDKGATSRCSFDQAFDFNPLQGDAHGGSADIQVLGQLRFGGDSLAVSPSLRYDQTTQLIVQLHMQ